MGVMHHTCNFFVLYSVQTVMSRLQGHHAAHTHFFHHFILNRTFFYVECEMFSFLLSICIIVFALNTVLFLYIFNINGILSSFLTIVSSIIDALLFSIWKAWKYLLFEILFLELIQFYLLFIKL